MDRMHSNNLMNFRDNQKEKILTDQKEAAMRRRRRQFKTGILDDSNNDFLPREFLLCTPEPKWEVNSQTFKEILSINGRDQKLKNVQRKDEIPFKQVRDTLCDLRSIHDISRTGASNRQSTIELVDNVLHTENSMNSEQIYVNNRCDFVAADESCDKETSSIRSEKQNRIKENVGLKRSPSSLMQMIHGTNHQISSSNAKTPGNFSSVSALSTFTDSELSGTGEVIETNVNIANSSSGFVSLLQLVNFEDTSQVKKILMKPLPKECGLVKCYIKRYRGKSRLCPEYRVYLDDGDQFLMTSKKRAKKTSSNYLISIGRNDYCKSSTNIIGKLRANFLGTEFQIYDAGKNPKHLDAFFDEKNYDEPRSELGAVLYSSNILGNRGPRKMQVCINRVNENGESTIQWKPTKHEDEMLECFKANNDMARKHLLFYENRQPKWNEDIGSYVLNFDKRVSLASVKNFQLIDPTNPEGKILMQFGKKGQDEFIMDVQHPMSLFQAFAVSLSSCDSKLGVD